MKNKACISFTMMMTITGNYPLARVLPQIYNLNRERIQEHVMALACILPRCEINDKLALLQLFTLVAADNSMVSLATKI